MGNNHWRNKSFFNNITFLKMKYYKSCVTYDFSDLHAKGALGTYFPAEAAFHWCSA